MSPSKSKDAPQAGHTWPFTVGRNPIMATPRKYRCYPNNIWPQTHRVPAQHCALRRYWLWENQWCGNFCPCATTTQGKGWPSKRLACSRLPFSQLFTHGGWAHSLRTQHKTLGADHSKAILNTCLQTSQNCLYGPDQNKKSSPTTRLFNTEFADQQFFNKMLSRLIGKSAIKVNTH